MAPSAAFVCSVVVLLSNSSVLDMNSISDLPPEDARLFTHMGHFLFWYSAVELALTDLIAKAIGFEDREKLELLVSGMDARRKCQCLRGASGYMEIGPNLKSRMKYFEDSIIKLRNKFAHRVAILPAGSSKLMFGTFATISKIHTSSEVNAKDTIRVEDLFGKARWLNWFAADLAKALGELVGSNTYDQDPRVQDARRLNDAVGRPREGIAGSFLQFTIKRKYKERYTVC